jgi:hypothetical protein
MARRFNTSRSHPRNESHRRKSKTFVSKFGCLLGEIEENTRWQVINFFSGLGFGF